MAKMGIMNSRSKFVKIFKMGITQKHNNWIKLITSQQKNNLEQIKVGEARSRWECIYAES